MQGAEIIADPGPGKSLKIQQFTTANLPGGRKLELLFLRKMRSRVMEIGISLAAGFNICGTVTRQRSGACKKDGSGDQPDLPMGEDPRSDVEFTHET